MATVGFRIRTKNKSYVFIKIYLYTQKSVRLETSTGIKIYSKYWNKNLQQIDYETPILMEITGHSRESTFLSYIGENPNKDAVADVFMERLRRLGSEE